MTQINMHIGSDFDDFLREHGLFAEVEVVALKRVVAFQINLDDSSVTMKQLEQTARTVGRTLKVELA